MFQQRRAPFLGPPRARGEFAGGQLRCDLKHRTEGRSAVTLGRPIEIPCWVGDKGGKGLGSWMVGEGVQHCVIPSALRIGCQLEECTPAISAAMDGRAVKISGLVEDQGGTGATLGSSESGASVAAVGE